jgi:hypothetical protein
MSASEQEITQLKEHIAEGAEQTKSYLASLQAKLGEYDEHYKLTETASSYLQAGIDRAHSSVDELKALGATLSHSTKETSDAWVVSAKASLAKVQTSLEDLKLKASDYDQRAKTALTTTVSSTSGAIGTSIEHIVTSTRQTAMSGIAQISATIESIQTSITESATAAGASAFAFTGSVIKKAEEVDEKLGLSGTVTNAATLVTGKVTELDKQYGVSEKAMAVDEKVSGGLGVSLLGKGADLMHQGVDYLTSTIQSAKAAAEKKE